MARAISAHVRLESVGLNSYSAAWWSMRESKFDMSVTGPPPMKWSDLKYGFATKEDCNGEEAQA